MVDGGAAGLQLITAGPVWQGRDVREAGGLPAGHTPVPYGDEGVCVAQWLVRRHLATRARGGTARAAASAFGRSQAARLVIPSRVGRFKPPPKVGKFHVELAELQAAL